ncbi:uncharacterized protein LOC131091295 [Melospiza georgiana]|uniref:uncharacterized protein LOC131091295 n=1 Tax=Melospiza georgiana TaxID=44398 RepID=UPI0025AC30D8|nr:uncharacterized protein LOC131091295 [Melospiza georgiana]
MAELAGRGAGCVRAGSPVPREEEPCSSSSSVCTEDLAASFWEAMVEPLLCQQEPAGDVPRAGAHPGQDEPLFPAGRSPDTATEPSRAPRQHSSASRSSLESLGARISRLSLSQSHGRVSRPGPPAQAALAHGDGARGELLGTAGHPWIAAGMAAGRSRAGAGTGAPGSSAPRASRATARGHLSLWGHGRNVTFGVAAMDREGAASSRSAGTVVGAPRPWRSPLSPGLRGDQKGELPCKVQPWGLGSGVYHRHSPSWDRMTPSLALALVSHVVAPGMHQEMQWKGGKWDCNPSAGCQGLAGQPLWRSQEGTRELGSGARPWSQGDRARTGLALLGHTRDTCHRCHTDLQSTGQGARVSQEQLDKERRKITTAREEKLELLERLRELERGSRHLLRQRLRVLHRLQGLLQRDRAQSLRLLREATEQEPLGSSAQWEHRPSRAGGSAALGNSPVALGNPPVALRNAPVAFRGHSLRPGTALAPGPSPAALSRALHVLRGLRQQIQRRLGQWQGLQGALGAAGQRNEVIRGWEGGHGVGGGAAATEGSRSPEGAPDPGESGPSSFPEAGLGFRGQAAGVGVSESLGDPQIPPEAPCPALPAEMSIG